MSCSALELKLLCAAPEQQEATASSAQAGFALFCCYVFADPDCDALV